MRRLVSMLVLCTLLFEAHAQKAPIKFGDVPLEQLKMTRYDKDSSAAAVVLADYGETVIDYNQTTGFEMNFERIRRIKILTKDGLAQADFSIMLYHNNSGDDEKITGLKAVTYNLENGKVVESKVKTDGIFKEKFDANRDLMKLTWPNVKEGSVIEITYSVNSDFFFNLQDWQFQDDIPVVWSEYRTRIPEYFTYDKYMQGYIPLVINEQTKLPRSINLSSIDRGSATLSRSTATTISNESINYTENRFRWVAQNVPAFKPEPFITTANDYISEIKFELSYTRFPNGGTTNYMGSWEDINKQFAESENFGAHVKGNGFLKKTVDGITAGLTTPEEKMNALCNYVKQNIAWNEVYRDYATSIKKVFEEKKGNSGEINLLLISMLEKADLTVYPVLISTRNHGFLRENIPVSTQFNSVICQVQVGDKSFLLDATEKLLPVGALPEQCLNGKGLAISKDGYRWVDLQSPGRSRTIVNVDLTLNNSGELKGTMQIDKSGYHGLKSRKNYFSKGEPDYIKDFLGSRSWELSKSEFRETKEIQNPFKEIHELNISDHVTSAGNVLYMNPFLLNREESNPFKPEKREYPVDYGSPFDQMYVIKVVVPDDYIVEELPKSKIFMLPGSAAKYLYNVTQLGNTISITSNISINKSLFTQDEYPNLREFYNQVVAKQAEQIVFKKK
jgi:hypothetical protein